MPGTATAITFESRVELSSIRSKLTLLMLPCVFRPASFLFLFVCPFPHLWLMTNSMMMRMIVTLLQTSLTYPTISLPLPPHIPRAPRFVTHHA